MERTVHPDMKPKRTPAAAVALGGVFAALAITLMFIGGIIPVATYVIPVLCMLMLQLILKVCGSRIAWAWYGAVAFLSIFVSPDLEAACVFAFLGYYPILKPWFDKYPSRMIIKLIFFNADIVFLYCLLLNIIGIAELQAEFADYGKMITVVLLGMGNVLFSLLDRLLGMDVWKKIMR